MRIAIAIVTAVALVAIAGADDNEKNPDAKWTSGPQIGSILPGPFEVLNVNGPHKGRYHCLVCEFAQDPAVLVFAREPEEEKDGPLGSLLQKLQEATQKHKELYLRAGVIFLSPAARSSTTDKKVEDPKKLVEEAMARDALLARLTERGEKLKNVIVACSVPDEPKKYKLSPKAEVTVVFYRRLKVLENFAFEKMTDDDVTMMMDKIEQRLRNKTKK